MIRIRFALFACGAMVALGALPAGSAAEKPAAGDDLFAQADRMLEKVSDVMQLEVKHPVRKEMTTREAVQAYLHRQLDRQRPGSKLEDLGEALTVLGLLPADYDLAEGVVALLSDQVAGFYDPEKSIFYVADWLPDSLRLPTMAHELAHALQDQHYDLERLLQPTPGEQDADMAFQAVVEGQGVAVMTQVLVEPMGLSLEQVAGMMQALGDPAGMLSASEAMGVDTAALRKSPPFLLSSLMFPYTEGMQFFLAFLKERSWEEAGVLFRDTPASTEEILHPEKYLHGRDLPQPVEAEAMEAALPPGWQVFFRERLGEFTTREMLGVQLGDEQAAAAAAGWDGDRTLIARSPDGKRKVLLQRSVWDSEKDAVEYFRAWVEMARSRHPDASPLEFTKDQVAGWSTRDGGVRIWRDGVEVGVVEGAPSSMWTQLFDEQAGGSGAPENRR